MATIQQGPRGQAGPAGRDGRDGQRGADGIAGQRGDKGLKGDQGLTGKSGVGSPGVAGQRGERGYQGDQGVPGPAGGGGSTIEDPREYYGIGNSEVWVTEYLMDFTGLGSTVNFTLIAFTRQDIVAGGTYHVRIGGTAGVADGTVAATLVTSQSSYPSTPDSQSGSVSNPGGKKLVKITAAGSSFSARARIKNILIQAA